MEKNWLIRTKSNHILGPISKEKVVELYQNGSIKADDEVCSGNGYWFFIREDDMVSRFLMGNESQGFNPISEAKDVLTQGQSVNQETDDVTTVNGVNLSSLNEVSGPPPKNHTPVTEHAPSPKEPSPAEVKKKNNEFVAPKVKTPKVKPVLKKQSYLQYVSILGFIILFLVIYFRKTIISHFFQGEVTLQSLSLIQSAYAQEEVPGKKKSS